ncbi:hypothetical protein NA57DRAFT_71681 [Rhizodiscina lignyota]|uniref:AA1-like domain-containing protein n=1 Tax=Rhizodiscina lignyota TaxID=1504668 RepID=A0A9P4INF0_9PEZI|nr:hypothetical protein NA57DRAFT_71681 [Rhizodiscina lignyota]
MRTSALVVAIASMASSVSALVAARLSTATLSETAPWKLTNIQYYISAVPSNETTNSTTPSSISFHIADTSPGLQFEGDCKRTVPANGSLTDGLWYPCGDIENMFWQFDSDKAIHIQHGWTDPSVGNAGQDFVTCFGSWATSAHPFAVPASGAWEPSTLKGTNYTQGCMEIYCTEMTA